jgi:hypothetical protein
MSIGIRRIHISTEMMMMMGDPESIDIEYDREAEQVAFYTPGMWKINRSGKKKNQMARVCVSLNKLMNQGRYVLKTTTEDGKFIFTKSIE